MPDTIRVRFATNRNPVPGPTLFGPKFRDNDPKHYVTGSINVIRLSNLPDTGWGTGSQLIAGRSTNRRSDLPAGDPKRE